jgi:hypothetical protein
MAGEGYTTSGCIRIGAKEDQTCLDAFFWQF